MSLVPKTEISVGLSQDGLEQIDVFVENLEDRAQALRLILKTMPEIQALEFAVTSVLKRWRAEALAAQVSEVKQ